MLGNLLKRFELTTYGFNNRNYYHYEHLYTFYTISVKQLKDSG